MMKFWIDISRLNLQMFVKEKKVLAETKKKQEQEKKQKRKRKLYS